MVNRKRIARRASRAFTLIEVLIVIAILLALGGLVVVNLIPKKAEADIDLTRVQLDQLDAGLKMFVLDMKRYPTEEEGLPALWDKSAIEDEEEARSWKGPYLANPCPKDTWGSDWLYRNPAEDEAFPFDIVSLGPDRQEDTEDDITNHDRFRDEQGEISEEFGTGGAVEAGSGGT